MLELILTRQNDDGVQTTGIIQSKDGIYGRYTLERPWKNNQKNISCIPPGKYLCKKTWFWKGMTYHYMLQNVPHRSGIFIHPGNYFFDIQGCILIGTGYSDINHDGKKDVLNTKITVKELETRLGFQDFMLTIKW